MNKENYLGVDVCCLNMPGALAEIDRIIMDKKPSFVVAINPEKIMKAQEDENLKKLLNKANVQLPDGVGIVIASRLLRRNIKERVTGIELMENICRRAAEMGYKVFLLGAKPGVAEEAGKILKEKFKGLKIAGTRDGYFTKDKEIINDIKKASPDILFVAMGSPKQEYWIAKNIESLNVPLCMGVGGSYDVICGTLKRAPKWMCKAGLEWLYRLIKEPWRYKRMMVLPKFLVKTIFGGKQS